MLPENIIGSRQVLHSQIIGFEVDSLERKINAKIFGHRFDKLNLFYNGYISLAPMPRALDNQTEFLAPLMAKFEPEFGEVYFWFSSDDYRTLEVRWLNMEMKDVPGKLSFGLSLHLDSGKIVFYYETLPVTLDLLKDKIKAGLSDAYR